MPRVKRGTVRAKKRKKLLSQVKGYRWGRKNSIKAAKTAILKAGVHAYTDRRKKKRVFRGLANIRIGAFARENGLSYSRLIDAFKKNKIELNRQILADLAANYPEVLKKVLVSIKK